jgi:hypothetical protein
VGFMYITFFSFSQRRKFLISWRNLKFKFNEKSFSIVSRFIALSLSFYFSLSLPFLLSLSPSLSQKIDFLLAKKVSDFNLIKL